MPAYFKYSHHKTKGFTLVELLVVISIIAILSVIGITVFSGVQKNARDAKRISDIKAIANALEQYHLQYGGYPCGLANSNSSVIGDGSQANTYGDKLKEFFSGGVVPTDPLPSKGYPYAYFYTGSGTGTSAGGTCDTTTRIGTNYFLESYNESKGAWNPMSKNQQ